MHAHTPNIRRHIMICLLAFIGLSGSAHCVMAQGLPIVVSPQVRMSPGTEAWRECTVGVSQTDKNDVLVIALGGGNALGYAVLDWGSILPIPSTLDEGVLDPYITQHPIDGSLWFAANGSGNGPIVGWKNAGDLSIPSNQTYVFSNGGIEDKPGIAIGIAPSPLTGLRTYILRMKKTQGSGVCNSTHHEKQSFINDPTIPRTWPVQPVEADPNAMQKCDYLGWGAAPVVLDDGRIVVALSDEWATNQNHQKFWKYNRGLPYIVYARPEDYDPINDVYDWKSDDPNNPIRIDPDNTITATTITEDCLNICPRTDCSICTTCGDTPMQIDRRKNAPSIAVDRSPEPPLQDHVFVAFYAKSDATSTNTDLYIARSTDGGLSFPDMPGDGNLLHITDAMLGLTELPDYVNNPDQMVPAIAVDACGDINVMFYDNRNDTNPNDCEYWVDVYFARISNFATNPTIQQWRLTPQSFRVDNLPAAEYLGDYHHLSVSADGNTIYAAYIARNNADPVNGIQTCYLHRINLNCLGPASDMTGDGLVTDADMTTYMTAYNSRGTAADVNLDWSVDANDLLLYADWFAAKK